MTASVGGPVLRPRVPADPHSRAVQRERAAEHHPSTSSSVGGSGGSVSETGTGIEAGIGVAVGIGTETETETETGTGSRTVGAEERMRALYTVHSRSLINAFLYWTHGDWQAAEDLTQETMVRAWKHLDKLDHDPLAIRSWLRTVARRIAIDFYRARTSRPLDFSDRWAEWEIEAQEPFAWVHEYSVIETALQRLSEEKRAVLAHVYLLDQTVPQAARELGIAEGTAKSRLHYALRELRDALDAVES
jgi:RNA polymerase sigma-70 factor (ECF subfamily)